MKRLRCILGLHGPYWTASPIGLGPYSWRMPDLKRVCPHCGATWEGRIVDRHVGQGVRVRALGQWERVS